MFGAAAGAAAVASVIRPFQGGDRAYGGVVCTGATTASGLPCGAGTTRCGSCCCKSGVACADAATSTCGCPAGTTKCGNACCKAGVACASAANSTCSGTNNAVGCTGAGTACGSTCCAAGQCCSSGTCGPCSVCSSGADLCTGGLPACPNNNTCSCATRQGGGFVCINSTGTPPGHVTPCASDADCSSFGSGWVCISTSCGTACEPPCSTGT